MKNVLLPIVTAILWSACSANVETRDESAQVAAVPDSIVLERTVCFGRCPAYRLRISAAGAVRFEPTIPAGTAGTATIAAAAYHDLAAELEAADFDSFPARIQEDRALCAREATDHPSAIITVYRGTESKTVDDYTGCAPADNDPGSAQRLEILRRLPARIDSVAGAARWIRPVELR
jgi:hypothetical protein